MQWSRDTKRDTFKFESVLRFNSGLTFSGSESSSFSYPSTSFWKLRHNNNKWWEIELSQQRVAIFHRIVVLVTRSNALNIRIIRATVKLILCLIIRMHITLIKISWVRNCPIIDQLVNPTTKQKPAAKFSIYLCPVSNIEPCPLFIERKGSEEGTRKDLKDKQQYKKEFAFRQISFYFLPRLSTVLYLVTSLRPIYGRPEETCSWANKRNKKDRKEVAAAKEPFICWTIVDKLSAN